MSLFTTQGYNEFSEAVRVEEIDSPDQKYVGEVLLDDSAIDASETPLYVYVDMSGFKHLGLQGTTTIVTDELTITIEASIQDDGTAPASCSFIDVTNAWFGVASWVDTDFLVSTENIAVKWVRIKYEITTGTADDAGLTIWSKKMY